MRDHFWRKKMQPADVVFEGLVTRPEKDQKKTGPRLEKTGLQVRSFGF